MKVEVTIGWTKSAMPEYSSFSDGYRHGAEQHVETVEVEVHENLSLNYNAVLGIAEAAFMATNAPYEVTGMAGEIREAIAAAGYRGQGAHYSLSVGDTVMVGEVMVSCEPTGWKQVHPEVSV